MYARKDRKSDSAICLDLQSLYYLVLYFNTTRRFSFHNLMPIILNPISLILLT